MKLSRAQRALALLAVLSQPLCAVTAKCGASFEPPGTVADGVAAPESPPNQFIVFLKARAGSPGDAAARLTADLQAAQATAAGAAAGAPAFTLLKTIDGGAGDHDAEPPARITSAAAAGVAGSARGVRAMVLSTTTDVAQLLRASPLVRAVVPDSRAASGTGTPEDDAAAGGAAGATVARHKQLPAALAAAASAGGPRLRRTPLLPGERIPLALARIESVLDGKVGVLDSTSPGRGIVVAVADTGIECEHPDLCCAPGGRSWVRGSAGLPDDGNATVDNNGHGTHVAGIIGARNNGRGVVGVAPGVRLLPLKVLDGRQDGSLSSLVEAMAWLLDGKKKRSGVRNRVRMMNLSTVYRLDPTSKFYAQSLAAVCDVFRQLSSAGVLTVAAAGNHASSIAGWVPAACPAVLAVTALNKEGSTAASYSNWLPADASASDRARIMTAPGTTYSTVPRHVVPAGYTTLTGTSMAAPMVAGVAAACIAAGGVRPGARGNQVMAAVQAAAHERLVTFPAYPYDYAGGRNSSRWFGALLWAGVLMLALHSCTQLLVAGVLCGRRMPRAHGRPSGVTVDM